MITEHNDGKNWAGAQNENGNGGDANKGLATEGKGRETNPDLYENDVLGKVAKRKKDDIWSRGKEVRTRHREEE